MDNLIQKSINQFEEQTLMKFQPSKDFYAAVGINRLRFWQLVREEKDITVNEAQSIADYFTISLNDFFTNKNPEATTNC